MSSEVKRNFNPHASYAFHRFLVRQSTASMFMVMVLYGAWIVTHLVFLGFASGLPSAIYDSYYSCEASPQRCGGTDDFGTSIMLVSFILALVNGFRGLRDRPPHNSDEVSAKVRTSLAWALTGLILVQTYLYMEGVTGLLIVMGFLVLAANFFTGWLRVAFRGLNRSQSQIRDYNYVAHAARRTYKTNEEA